MSSKDFGKKSTRKLPQNYKVRSIINLRVCKRNKILLNKMKIRVIKINLVRIIKRKMKQEILPHNQA
jgi:hypothetical protein